MNMGPPKRLDFFGLHDHVSRALPGDADYMRPPPPYPCIEPPGPFEYVMEVGAAIQEQAGGPLTNYLT